MPTRADAESFAAQLGAFVEDLRVRRYSPASERFMRNSLPRLFVFLADQGVSHSRDVTEAHLVAFARALEDARTRHHQAPLAPMTRWNYLRAARSFFTFLARRGVLLHNPAAELPLPKPHYLPRRVLTVREAARLMTAPSPWTHLGQRERAILEVLYGSGIRRGECVRLDVSDADLVQGTLLVKDSKGKRDRLVPLPGRAAAAIDVYLRESRPEILKDPCEKALFLSYTTASRGRVKIVPVEKPFEGIPSVCLLDNATVLSDPSVRGKLISSLALGEKVLFWNEDRLDSVDRNKKYLKIRLSDGKEGWAPENCIAIDSKPAVTICRTIIYLRPDLVTITNKEFAPMEFIAVSKPESEWCEAKGLEGKKTGWIKSIYTSIKDEDITVALLASKALAETNKDKKKEKLNAIINNPSFSSSIFIDTLKTCLAKIPPWDDDEPIIDEPDESDGIDESEDSE